VARAPLARPTDAPPIAHETVEDAPFLPAEDLPRHVAIIMDGNRRWARQHAKP
jgi:undecaprenyl diphosphate synthase